MPVLLLLLLAACSPSPASIVHPAMTAAHADAACSGCHEGSFEAPVAEDCAACHEPPLGHPEGACEGCHDGVLWDGAAFDHPVLLPHQSEVSACDACHLDQAGGATNCLRCHSHRSEAVSPPHMDRGVPGYEYKTDACLRCHPDAEVH